MKRYITKLCHNTYDIAPNYRVCKMCKATLDINNPFYLVSHYKTNYIFKYQGLPSDVKVNNYFCSLECANFYILGNM